MPAYKSEKLTLIESKIAESDNAVTDEDLDEFCLPDDVEPMLSEEPLYTENT